MYDLIKLYYLFFFVAVITFTHWGWTHVFWNIFCWIIFNFFQEVKEFLFGSRFVAFGAETTSQKKKDEGSQSTNGNVHRNLLLVLHSVLYLVRFYFALEIFKLSRYDMLAF